MSILGATLYISSLVSSIYSARKVMKSNFARKYSNIAGLIGCALLFFGIFGNSLLFQYLGVDMGTYLYYKGQVLIPAGGI